MPSSELRAPAAHVVVRRASTVDRPAVDALTRFLPPHKPLLRSAGVAPGTMLAAFLDELSARRRQRHGDPRGAVAGSGAFGFIPRSTSEDLLEADPDEIVITDLVVAGRWRGQGIGRAVVGAVPQVAARRGVARERVTTLTANGEAQAACAAMGYRPVGVTPERAKQPGGGGA